MIWGPQIKIPGVDRGEEYCDESDSDSDEDEDDGMCSDGKEIGSGVDDSSSDVILTQEGCDADVQEISHNLENISEHNLLDDTLSKKLKEHHKSLFKRLSSSTIPIYECVDTQNNKDKKHQKKISPFLEIRTHNDQIVYIRKTTAIWLLQEGERVSIDRIFRVRHKQPYSSDIPVSTVVTSTTLTVGHEQKDTKVKNTQGKVSSKECNSPTRNNKTDVTVMNTVDLTSVTDVLLSDDEDSELWVKIRGITLYNVDKEIILDGKWLWGTHLTAVQYLLKEKFTNINGLMDTSVIMHKDHTISVGSVQILHVNSNHWITISTLLSANSDYDVIVYDSLYFQLSQTTKVQLAKLIKTTRKKLRIKVANTNKQAGSDDCGVFAAAYCTTLANGQDPSSFVYRQDSMREHLVHCLENKLMVCFPVIKERRSGTARFDTVSVYCYCRLPDDGSPMVQCDGKGCKEWFHQSCITTKVVTGQKWYCLKCTSKHGN